MKIPRWLKIALLAVVAFVAAVAIGLIVLVNTIDLGRYTKLATDEVKAATGRELRIGKVDIKIFPRIAVVADDVALANAPWGSRPEMLRAKRVEASVALLPLLRNEIEVTRLALVEPDALIETDAKGTGNWVFKPAAARSAEDRGDGGGHFDLQVASIDRGRLAWHDGARKATVQLAVSRLRLEREALGGNLDLDLDAAFRDQPFTLKGSMGTLRRLLAKDAAWPVDLTAATDGAGVAVKGALDFRTPVPTFDGTLKGTVKDPAGLGRLAGRPLDLPVPLALDAKAAAASGEFVVDPLKVTIGKSAIDGRIAVKTAGARPYVNAALKSLLVDLAQGAARAPTGGKGGGARPPRVFSEDPFPLELLRSFDADLEASIARLVLPNRFPIEGLQVKAALKNGRLDVQPFQATIGGGAVAGRATLDAARGRAPTLALNVDGKGISAEKVATAMGHAGTVSGGATDVAIALAGPGDSTARFMAGANGEARLVAGPARTSGAALDFGGDVLTKVADLANPSRRTEKQSEIRCMVARLPVRDGIATAQRTIAVETNRIDLVAAGTINLRAETLDLALRPTVKEGLGLGAATLVDLVRVTGTLASPSVGVDTLASAKAALTVGGAVMTGGLSLLGQSIFSRTTADPHPCQTALAGGTPARTAPSAAQGRPKEDEGGVLGSIRRLFK
jgi:uncharacterized protein involved in outer membrane biogenesis